MRISRLMPTLLALGSAIAVAPATASAAPLDASFEYDPSEPRPGETITFTGSYGGGGTGPARYAWDLDADGEFDDGSTPTVARAFDAGDHVVRLRVTQAGAAVVTDIETQSVRVADPTPSPPPPPSPAPSPSPTPTPTPAPTANQPPTATIDNLCIRLRPDLAPICEAPLTKVGKDKTFKATKSSDPDGTIVRYEWDLNGDGTFERDTAATPEVTGRYESMASQTIRLRVTDDAGATAETSMALIKLEPDCTGSMVFRKIRAISPCFRRTVSADGKVVSYRSAFPVDVNGIIVTPGKGRPIEVRQIRTRAGGSGFGKGARISRLELAGTGAAATLPVRDTQVTLDTNGIAWKLGRSGLQGVQLPGGSRLNGLRISGMDDTVALPAVGEAEPAFWLQLPAQFGAPTSAKPVGVRVKNQLQLSGPLVRAASPRARAAQLGALQFDVPNAALGPIGLNKLTVKYDGVNLWEVAAGMSVPPPLDAEFTGGAGIRDGALTYAEAEGRFKSGLGPLGPGLYLTRIKFRIEIKPDKTQCVSQFVDVYGQPAVALCGEVGFSAGPMVEGKRALGLDGALGFATWDGKPSVFFANGKASVAGIEFAKAAVEVHTHGYFKVGGTFQWGFPGYANVTGGIELEMLGTKFNASAQARACLEFVDLCEGARAIVSSKGLAACLDIDLWATTWHPGVGYKWGGPFTPYFAGCDIGPYREQIAPAAGAARAAAAAGTQEVELPGGLPGEVFAAKGADRAPVITVIGPNGERYESPSERRAVVTEQYMALPNEQEKLTQVLVPSPAAGRWRVEVREGSLVSLKTAHGVDAPKVSASVLGKGHARTLRYEVDERPGQSVRFVERGASTGGAIGTARGAEGKLRFTPADGLAERRDVVAVVTQDGMPRDEIVVARYAAPAARKAGKVRKLSVERRGSTLRVAFERAGLAARHRVDVRLSTGRRVVALVRGASSVVRGVPRGAGARVTVHGVTRSGLEGRAARVRVRPVRR